MEKQNSKEGQVIIDSLTNNFEIVLSEGTTLTHYLQSVGNPEQVESFERLINTLGDVMENIIQAVYHERRTGEKLIEDEKV